MDALKATIPGLSRLAASDRAVQAVFAATLFSSALLLFAVQPMFARMALPKLGGAPAVWAVSMCFFQTALLAGYGYAWALNRFLPPGRAVQVHLTLLAATTLALPIGLPAALGEPPAGDAYLWLLGVLGLGVGLPFFAVSANAPLLQAWFARTGHPDARDPYFLYGASNIGSLLALIAYPLFIEPTLGLSSQTVVWSVGFTLLAAGLALSGTLMVRRVREGASAEVSRGHVSGPPVATADRALWVLFAAIPSGLLVATTTHIATDIASAPLVWVIPLALFLATFVLAFRARPPVSKDSCALVLLMAMALSLITTGRFDAVAVALISFFCAALLCHRELYERRPAAAQLTQFYVWMSAGGVIGGIFAALIAPQMFTRIVEYPALLAAAALCRPGVVWHRTAAVSVRHVATVILAAIIVLLVITTLGPHPGTKGAELITRLAAVGIAAMILFTKARADHALLVTVAVVALFMSGHRSSGTEKLVDRSFFGTIRVYDTPDGRHRIMLHGTTAHGMRRLKTSDGKPVAHPEPATYYHPAGPMARGVTIARMATGKTDGGLTVGIVGLGTGSLACFARPADVWRFYEIDPAVVRMARDPDLFGFVPRRTPDAPIIVGDARLTLARERVAPFDYLVIDAFSSDAVPAHLLTREAFALYFSKLAPGGLVALHVSNRYLDLEPAVTSTAATLPGVIAISARWTPLANEVDGFASTVVFLTRDQATASAIEMLDGTSRDAPTVTPWTDDFSDVQSALLRRLRGS